MTTVVPELPAEVMAALGPVLEILGAEVRANVTASLRRKAQSEGQDVVISNGRSSYQNGFDRIMADVFGAGAAPDVAPRPVTIDDDDDDESERTCECAECDGSMCRGDCEWCNDRDCSQCHPDYHPDNLDCGTCHDIATCCGYCDRCDEHHDYGDQWAFCSSCERCSECNHSCSD